MLEGDLTDFTLPDVLRLLALTSKSGRLRLDDGHRQGRVDVVEGMVRAASADAQRLPLARRILGSGLVTAEPLLAVLADRDALPTDLDLARALVTEADVDAATLADLLREQTADAVFDLLRWDEGGFRFAAIVDETRGPSVLDLAVSVDELLDETARRLDAWPTLEERTGALDAVVTIRRPGRERAEVALPPEGWTLLALIDGRRTLNDLVMLSGHGEYRTRRTLGALIDEGVVAVGDSGGEAPVERLLRDHAALAEREAALAEATSEDHAPAAAVEAPAPAPASEPAAEAVDEADAEVRPAPATRRDVRRLQTKVKSDRLRTDPSVDEDLVTRLIEGVAGL